MEVFYAIKHGDIWEQLTQHKAKTTRWGRHNHQVSFAGQNDVKVRQ